LSEEEFEKNNRKYQELVDSISDVFISMDKNLRYTYWNKASEKLT
jgi:PAS domain-containing protein